MNKLPNDIDPKQFEPTNDEQEKIKEVLTKLDALLKLNDLTIVPTTIIRLNKELNDRARQEQTSN